MHSRPTFVPRLESLEDRCVPAPIAGGDAVQSGSVLNVGVALPANGLFIIEDGNGDVAASWNGSPFQFFAGVNNIQVSVQGAANAFVFLNLGALTAPEQLNVSMLGFANSFFEHVTPGGASLSVQENPPVPTFLF